MPTPINRRAPGVPAPPTGTGDIGASNFGGSGFVISDESRPPIWAVIDAQPDAGLNAYGFTRVNDGTDDGTFPDLDGTTETSDGDTLGGNLIAWEVNGRTDVATDGTVKVLLIPNRLGRGYTFTAPGSGSATASACKGAVRVATTTAGTLASSFENGDTVDGVTLATGDRILIKNQSSGAENGIYTVNASGAPTRAADCDSSAEFVGAMVVVSEGTANADTVWICTTNAPITVGTTATTWSQLYPDAAPSVPRGVVTNSTQTFGGTKTFNDPVYIGSAPDVSIFPYPYFYVNTPGFATLFEQAIYIGGTGSATNESWLFFGSTGYEMHFYIGPGDTKNLYYGLYSQPLSGPAPTGSHGVYNGLDEDGTFVIYNPAGMGQCAFAVGTNRGVTGTIGVGSTATGGIITNLGSGTALTSVDTGTPSNLTGYAKGNGSALSASATIPGSDISGTLDGGGP